MGQRRDLAEKAGIAEQDVELAPALVDRGAEPVEGVVILEVERHERRGRAGGADLVVELLERALRAGERDHMRAGAREGERRGAADAARGAGHHREAVRERLVHGAEPSGYVEASTRCHPGARSASRNRSADLPDVNGGARSAPLAVMGSGPRRPE